MKISDGPSSPTAPDIPPSLIETMRAGPGGAMPLLEGHLERLQQSSAALGYPCPEAAEIRRQVAQTLAGLDTDGQWRLRLLLAPDGVISLETGALAALPLPLKVVVHGARTGGAVDWLLHKTTHRPWYAHAAQWLAGRPDIFDVLYWNDDEEMCEGSRSNLYVQAADGRWLTPPLEAGVLPGVQRQALLRTGQAQEARISRKDFLQAQAIRISNALRGWCDAVIVGA